MVFPDSCEVALISLVSEISCSVVDSLSRGNNGLRLGDEFFDLL